MSDTVASDAAQENDKKDGNVADLLRRRLTLFEAMMDTVPVGMVVADSTGKIVHGNRQLEKMVRHPVLHSEDASAYGEWISFHEDGRQVEAHEYPLAQIVSGEADRAELEVHYQRGDGTRFWMRIIGEPVFDDHGEPIGASVALVDIDEQRRLHEAQQTLIGELNHRVKNAFSVTQSIVNRTLRKAKVADDLRVDLDRRLYAYAQAHARLVGTKWGFAPLRAVARDVLDPIADERISIEGPDVELTSRLGISLSMAFYELATNAVKHGALSQDDGTVDLSWKVEEGADGQQRLHILWKERGGPVAVPPNSQGFGTFIIGRGLMAETGGKTEIVFPEDGFCWSLDMPLPTPSEEDELNV